MSLLKAVLDGELAVPCSLQSAIAGLILLPGHYRVIWPDQTVLKFQSVAMSSW